MENTLNKSKLKSMEKRLKAINKYLKNSSKNKYLGGNDGKAWYQNELLCFSNGYSAFMLCDDFDIPITNSWPIDIEILIPKNANTEVKIDLFDIKEYIKKSKSDKVKYPIYKIGNSYYNPNYIIECFNILGENFIFKQTDNQFYPAILIGKNGKALLCPVRPPHKT